MNLDLTDKELYILKYVLGEALCGVDRYEYDEYCSEVSYYFTDEEMNTAKDLLDKLHGENVRDFIDKVIAKNME